MIKDVTGIILTPGNRGENCKGNGKHFTIMKKQIECCCNECDYLMCCLDDFDGSKCFVCEDKRCPNNKNPKD